MGVRLNAIFVVCITTLGLAGCELTEQPVKANNTETAPVTKVVEPHGDGLPNPKPRPKTDPMYPPAEIIIGWHAKACGGFKVAASKIAYIGTKEIQNYFDFSCKNNVLAPEKVLTQLLKLDQAYYWPDDIKQYLWLQKQQINQQIDAKKQQQALNNKMQETLSSLATIEQQLLLREETKEQ